MDPFDLRDWPGFIEAGGDTTKPAIVDQIVIDSRRITSPHSLFTALKGANSDGHDFLQHSKAKFALTNQKYPQEFAHLQLLKVPNPLQALQEIAAVYRQKLNCQMVAIAGAFGKTMVKDLLYSFLATSKNAAASPESFNSQIGVPLSLFSFSKEHEIAVIEAGISEKGEMQRLAKMIKPSCGILTHLGKKHLVTLENIDTSANEMMDLFKPNAAWAFLPNHPFFEGKVFDWLATTYYWNREDAKFPFASLVKGTQDVYSIVFPDKSCYTSTIKSGFSYYLDLVNMAMKAAWQLGISKEAICSVLENYVIEPTKTEIWRSEQNITFINHCYSSDPQSIDQAIKLLDTSNGRKCFIFGGLRGNKTADDYLRVSKTLINSNLDVLCVYGNHPFESLLSEMQLKSPATALMKTFTYSEALENLKPILRHEDSLLIKGASKENFDHILQNYHGSLLSNLCTVNLAAVQSNIQSIRKKLPAKTRIMVMVKASAYGTDDLRMALFLATCGIDILGVSYVDEAVNLIRGGAPQDLFVLNAAHYETAKIVQWNLQVGVSNLSFIQALNDEAQKANKTIKVHLHVDTGMCRFGCRPEEALFLANEIQQASHLHLEGVMTHFASSDSPQEDEFTKKQSAKLDAVIAALPVNVNWRHAANSGGALRFDFPQYNMVRLGLAVFGLYPSKAVQESLDLKLAVSLTSRIVGINNCRKGETISYGRTYTVEKESEKIAVLPIGYFDGLHRNYSGKAYVLIRGQKAPMVGKICMDFMMVDITDIPNASIGDQALIFGEDDYGNFLSPEDLANKGDSIMHELITCLGPRIQRMFIFEESKQFR